MKGIFAILQLLWSRLATSNFLISISFFLSLGYVCLTVLLAFYCNCNSISSKFNWNPYFWNEQTTSYVEHFVVVTDEKLSIFIIIIINVITSILTLPKGSQRRHNIWVNFSSQKTFCRFIRQFFFKFLFHYHNYLILKTFCHPICKYYFANSNEEKCKQHSISVRLDQ